MKTIFAWLISLIFLGSGVAYAQGPYTNSAHGIASYGVKRSATGFPADYAKGNCAHCHEQHASIAGAEPAPTGGPDKYALFYNNYVSQTDGVCFKCHDATTTISATAIVNRSYSYRAGGWTDDTLNDILEAFTYGPPTSTTGSSHRLDDISTFITGKWGYTTDSNPCCACHNPHRAQRDPHTTSRGWPVSLPSQHSKDNNAWGLWGDNLPEATERMSNLGFTYQAPYRFGVTDTYEPDGSSTQDGSNLTDYVTFCTDCHNATNTIYSNTLGRNLRTIDWDNEKHGKGSADGAISMNDPYGTAMGKVLACTDCHEPHGAPNKVLIRQEVNGGALGGLVTTIAQPADCTPQTGDYNKEIAYLCNRCHKDDYDFTTSCLQNKYWKIHHDGDSVDPPYAQGSCGNCHDGSQEAGQGCNADRTANNCNCCHYHGSSVTNATNTPADRRTF